MQCHPAAFPFFLWPIYESNCNFSILCIFSRRCNSFSLTEDFSFLIYFSCETTIWLIWFSLVDISSTLFASSDFFRPNLAFFYLKERGLGSG